jgi:sugar lactone lactonase YvrE
MRAMLRHRVPGLLAITLAGCGQTKSATLARAVTDTLAGGVIRVMSSGPTAWSDSAGAALVEEGRFSGADGTPAELGQPRSLAVDEAGRIYVVDGKPASIKVFTPEGQLIRSIGREGEGPGEFRVGFVAARGGRIVLHDPQLARTSVWDTSGAFLRSWHSSCCYWSDIQVDRQGRIYVPSMSGAKPGDLPRGTPYVRWSLEGAELDTIWVPSRTDVKLWTVSQKRAGKTVSMMSTTVPFQPVNTHSLHPDGGVVYGWTGSFTIVRSATGQDSLRIFGRAWTPEPVSNQRRKAEAESRIKQAGESYGEANARAAFHLEDIPATLPAFMSLRVDPAGRVWARRYAVADTTRTSFDIFDSTGAYLGPVTAPVNIPEYGAAAWTRDGLVVVIEDAEGRPTVVRLRLHPSRPLAHP